MTLAYSPDGKTLASVSNNLDGKIRLWDTHSFQKIREFNGGGSRVLQFSPNGSLLASSGDFAELQIWNVKAGVKGRHNRGLQRAGDVGWLLP